MAMLAREYTIRELMVKSDLIVAGVVEQLPRYSALVRVTATLKGTPCRSVRLLCGCD